MSRSDYITYLFVQALIAYYQDKDSTCESHLKEAMWHLRYTASETHIS